MDGIFDSLMVPGVSVVEKILRPIVVYAFLLIGLRLAGKRELAQLNQMDLVVLLTISNTVQNAIIGNDNSLSGGLIGAITLLTINYFVVRLLYKHEKLDRLLEGDPETLIENSRILQGCLEQNLITETELATAAHKQGFASLADVEKATLEPGGAITFVGRKPDAEQKRHTELLERMEQLSHEIARLQNAIGGELS